MRAQRSKRYRKIIQQYTLTFGFREPYQVLVSSAFLRAIHRFHMPLQTSLTNTLHGSIKPFITKCSLAAIESQSEPNPKDPSKRPIRPPYLPPPTELPLRHCSHNDSDDPVPEAECLLDLLSGGALTARFINPDSGKMAKNKEHFVLASADENEGLLSPPNTKGRKRKRDEESNVDLRGLARQIPGVPIVYVKRSVMVLEELSGPSLGIRRVAEKEKIGRRRPRHVENDDDEEAEEKDDRESVGKEGAVEVEVQPIKKKRRKGPREPNPLSVKKKKVKMNVKTPKGDTMTHKATVPLPPPTETKEDEKKKRRRKHKGTGISQNGAQNAAEVGYAI